MTHVAHPSGCGMFYWRSGNQVHLRCDRTNCTKQSLSQSVFRWLREKAMHSPWFSQNWGRPGLVVCRVCNCALEGNKRHFCLTQGRGLHWWFVWGEHQKIRIIPPRWFIVSGFSRWGNCMIWREMCPCDTLQYFVSLETDGPRPRPRFPSSNMFWPWQKACAQDLLAVVKHDLSCLISDSNMWWNGYVTQLAVWLYSVFLRCDGSNAQNSACTFRVSTLPAGSSGRVAPAAVFCQRSLWALVFFCRIIWSQFSTRQVSPHSWYRFAQTQLCYKYYNASNLELSLHLELNQPCKAW